MTSEEPVDTSDQPASSENTEDVAGQPVNEAIRTVTAPSPRRLTRSRTDEWFGGVAGGLAEYFDTDPTLIRIAFVVAAILSSGFAILAYIVAWIVIPEAVKGDPGAHSPRRRPRNTGAIVWGGILVIGGTLVLLAQLDLNWDFPSWQIGLSIALILIGLLMVFEARRGGFHGGLTTLAVIVTLLLGISSASSFNIAVDGAFGDQRHAITRMADLEREYSHAFGSLTVDLRGLEIEDGTTQVEMSVVFGDGVLYLPDGVPYRIEADSVFGSIDTSDFDTEGIATSRSFTSPGYAEADRRLDIDISVVFGSGRIR